MMKWASSISSGLPHELAIEHCISEVRTQLGPGPVDLVFLFVSPHYQKAYHEIPGEILKGLEGKFLIGCSAAGIIGAGKEVEQQVAMSVTAARFPDVQLKPFNAQMSELPPLDSSPKTWRDWIGISSEQKTHFVLLADPFSFDPEKFLLGLDFAFPGSSKVGGLASGAVRPGLNALFLNDQVYHRGLAGVALMGNIAVDSVVAQGCRPIGYPIPCILRSVSKTFFCVWTAKNPWMF